MATTVTRSPRAGYVVQELVVALVVFALGALPLVRALSILPRVNFSLAQQSRREAWRSATDQVVVAGIDPNRSTILKSVIRTGDRDPFPEEQAGPGVLTGVVQREVAMDRPGSPRISALVLRFHAGAEVRSAALGFEIGSGRPSPPRGEPLPPLVPVVLQLPRVEPTDRPYLSMSQLLPAAAGAPYEAEIRARADPAQAGARIALDLQSPAAIQVRGVGVAAVRATAIDLAHGVRGMAWAEFAGTVEEDRAQDLGGGRTRWWHREDDGRVRIYEPSGVVEFQYGLSLERLAYRLGARRYLSGEAVEVDYETALAVAAGEVEAQIEVPSRVQAVFGAAWPMVAPSIEWEFGGGAGDSVLGNTLSLYTREGRRRWRGSPYLVATPNWPLPGIGPRLQSTWSFHRRPTALQPPEPQIAFSDVLEPQQVDFVAPMFGKTQAPLGRPQVNGLQATGPLVSVPLIP